MATTPPLGAVPTIIDIFPAFAENVSSQQSDSTLGRCCFYKEKEMDAFVYCDNCAEDRVHRKDESGELYCTKCGAKREAAESKPTLATEARA